SSSSIGDCAALRHDVATRGLARIANAEQQIQNEIRSGPNSCASSGSECRLSARDQPSVRGCAAWGLEPGSVGGAPSSACWPGPPLLVPSGRPPQCSTWILPMTAD